MIDTLYIYPTTQVMYHRPTPSFPPKKKKNRKERGSPPPKGRGPPPNPGQLQPPQSVEGAKLNPIWFRHPFQAREERDYGLLLWYISVLGLKLLPPCTGSGGAASHFEAMAVQTGVHWVTPSALHGQKRPPPNGVTSREKNRRCLL